MSERVPIVLCCSVCGARNYKTTRSRAQGTKPIELRKFCSHCKAHSIHKESK